jgi:hypothetical protein
MGFLCLSIRYQYKEMAYSSIIFMIGIPPQSINFTLLCTILDTYNPHCKQTYFQELFEDKRTTQATTHGIPQDADHCLGKPISFPPHFLAYSCNMTSPYNETEMDDRRSSYLQVEETESYVLNQLLCDIFGIEFGTELELEWVLLLHVLAHDLKHTRLRKSVQKF